jgi:hypothetical protein
MTLTEERFKPVAPGIYRLTKDITNPRPDRRMTRDWRKEPVIQAGRVFVVQAHRWLTPREEPVECVRVWADNGHEFHYLHGWEDLGYEVMRNLERIDAPTNQLRTVFLERGTTLESYGCGGAEVLAILYRRGLVSDQDVASAIQAWNDRADNETDEERIK